jgi:hypothetical protein
MTFHAGSRKGPGTAGLRCPIPPARTILAADACHVVQRRVARDCGRCDPSHIKEAHAGHIPLVVATWQSSMSSGRSQIDNTTIALCAIIGMECDVSNRDNIAEPCDERRNARCEITFGLSSGGSDGIGISTQQSRREMCRAKHAVWGQELNCAGRPEEVYVDVVDPDISEIRNLPTYAESYIGSPLVSVCIATYNRARILCERTLPTVINQTYKNWEAVIVGDACTDDTDARIASLGDSRIRFCNRPTNGPYPVDPVLRRCVAGTLPGNESRELARGRWIAPLDDDDEWTPDHIETLLATAFSRRAELIYGRLKVVIEGSPIQTWIGNWPPRYGDFALQGAIYHADLRGFRFDITAFERELPGDWDLTQRMLDAGVRFDFTERIVGTYNVRAPDGPFWIEVAARRGVLE